MKLNLGDLLSYKGYKSTDEIQFGMIVKIFEDLGVFGPKCFVEWGQADAQSRNLLESVSVSKPAVIEFYQSNDRVCRIRIRCLD